MKKQLFLLMLFGAHTLVDAAAATRKRQRIKPKTSQKQTVSAPLSLIAELIKDPAAFNESLNNNPIKQTNLLRELATASAETKACMLLNSAILQLMHIFKIACCIKDTDINLRSRLDGYTALSCAANSGNLEMVKLLIAKKADCNTISIAGHTPLLLAVLAGHYTVASLLIEAGANVNARNDDEAFPLYVAAERGETDLVLQLIQAGANVTKARHGWTPLDIAIENKHMETAKALIGTEATNNDWLFLQIAVDRGALEIVETLLARGTDCTKPYKDGCLPLCHAINAGHTDIARLLLQAGSPTCRADNPDCYLLGRAACSGSLEQLDLLLSHGAIVDQEKKSLYDEAVFHGHIDLLQELLRREIPGLEIIEAGGTLLHSIAMSEATDIKPILELLQTQSIDFKALDIKNEEGAYPIHFACERKDSDALQFLIGLGIDINLQNDYGETPLYVAAREGNLKAVQLLTAMKADTETKNVLGLFPHEIAYANGHKAIVQHLKHHRRQKNVSTPSASSSTDTSESSLSENSFDEAQNSENISYNDEPIASASISYEPADTTDFIRVDRTKHVKEQSKGLHAQYEDANLFAMRQEKELMAAVIYKQKKVGFHVKLKNIRNMSEKQDKFHTFSLEIDNRISYGKRINLQKADQEDRRILDEHHIKGDRGFAVIIFGKIEGAYYDIQYAQLDQGKRTHGFIGAFVYLFDNDGTCYHRCFHENRESRQRHNAQRPTDINMD